MNQTTQIESMAMIIDGFDYEREHGHPTPTHDWDSGKLTPEEMKAAEEQLRKRGREHGLSVRP